MTEFVAPHSPRYSYSNYYNRKYLGNKNSVAQPLKHVPSYYVLLEVNGSLRTILLLSI